MRKKVGRIFADGFLKSLIILLLLLGAAVLSYQAVMHFFHIPDNGAVKPLEEEAEPEEITKASIDDVSKNLIYSVDGESGEIDKLLLEIFHCGNKKLYYITIPGKTQFTMSDTLYQKLILVNPAVPQIMKYSSLTKYFPKETVYEYGILLLEELLGIKVSYYTVIPKNIYDTIFMTEDISTAVSPADVSQTEVREYPREMFREDYATFLTTLQTEEELAYYIEEIYPSFTSNITLEEKMNYLDSYCKTPIRNIFFELIAGDDENSAYIIDTAGTGKQLEEFLADD